MNAESVGSEVAKTLVTMSQKGWVSKMFGEDSSISSLRIVSLLCTVTASCVGIFAVSTGKNLTETSLLINAILVPVLGAKTLQKFSEVKKAMKDIKTKGFFSRLLSEYGDLSCSRFCMLWSVATGLGIAITLIVKRHGDLVGGGYLVGSFLASACLAKGVQKFAEVNGKSMEVDDAPKN